MKKLIAIGLAVAFLGSAGLVFADTTATPTVKTCNKAAWHGGKKGGKNFKSCKKGQKQCPAKSVATPGK
jgi:hypothetical protein